MRLRPYKPCDAEIIVSWCKDEAAFRRWTSDRYDKFPITAEDMNKKYIDPEFYITVFNDEDVITASGIPDNVDDLYDTQVTNDIGTVK